jgi:hypothetical protein
LFCQTIYQNGYNSTDRAVHGAETKKNNFADEAEPCQTEQKRGNALMSVIDDKM